MELVNCDLVSVEPVKLDLILDELVNFDQISDEPVKLDLISDELVNLAQISVVPVSVDLTSDAASSLSIGSPQTSRVRQRRDFDSIQPPETQQSEL